MGSNAPIWLQLVPSIVALLGIPLTAVAARIRENALHKDQQKREDMLRREQEAREDRLSEEAWERESRERQAGYVYQRWWERKADAYARIIEALWHMLNYPSQMEDDLYELKKLSDEERDELLKHWKQSERELRKEAD